LDTHSTRQLWIMSEALQELRKTPRVEDAVESASFKVASQERQHISPRSKVASSPLNFRMLTALCVDTWQLA
jgi:hypothetical protein